jgi:Nod factor-specific ABC transporter NodJ protein
MSSTTLDRRERHRGVLSLWRPPITSPRRASRTWLRNATLFRRGWKRFVLPNFLEPIFYLLAIGIGLGIYVRDIVPGIPYVEYIAPGLAAASAMYGAVFELTYNVFVKLRFHRVYDAVITTPLEPGDVGLGELMWGVTRSAMYGAVFLSVVVLFGYAHSPLAALAFLLLPLVGLAMGLLALIFTALIRDIELYTYFFNVFIIPLFLFSGIFFPVADLPVWAQAVAWATPLYHGVEMSRALVLTGELTVALAHIGWLLAFSALLLPPALNLFSRRLADGGGEGGV